MEKFELIIGNRTYSSWSMRPWLALKRVGATFSETRVPLYVPGYRQKLLSFSPSGKVPVLKHGSMTIWDSLAICEYLAELFPEAQLWPKDQAARAMARAVCAEMHAGFATIRNTMPFNCRAHGRRILITPEIQGEIDRIQGLWKACRAAYGKGGPWLFGSFGIADCMYIPVALRFVTYSVPLDASGKAYVDASMAHHPAQEWITAAEQETEVLESSEVGK